MAFELQKHPTQMAHFVAVLVFSPLSIAVVLLRLVAVPRSGRRLGLEDALAAVATLFAVLTNLGGQVAITILNGREISEKIAQSPSDFGHMRRWDMAALFFYMTHSLAVKLSVLALYRRIFGIDRAYRLCIYALAAAQTMLLVIFCIFQPLQCRPSGRYFDFSIPGTCRSEGSVILGFDAPNSLIDFAMVALAWRMIRPLHLSTAVKWRLRLVFGMGMLVGIIGFIKIAITYSPSAIYAFSMASIWTSVQMFVSVLCCCLPALHPFLPTADSWRRIYWRLTDRSSGKHGSAARPWAGAANTPDQIPSHDRIELGSDASGLAQSELVDRPKAVALSHS
ncbi:hypothetical protein CDD83_7346 [Cordyceps sp. RAO-2017]|nr:hypothetical protein CDD83_7346 [Cordyceps sp. RAO-2017]